MDADMPPGDGDRTAATISGKTSGDYVAGRGCHAIGRRRENVVHAGADAGAVLSDKRRTSQSSIVSLVGFCVHLHDGPRDSRFGGPGDRRQPGGGARGDTDGRNESIPLRRRGRIFLRTREEGRSAGSGRRIARRSKQPGEGAVVDNNSLVNVPVAPAIPQAG